MNLKHALTGLGIAGMLATGSFADAPKQKVYDIKTDTERILYKKGIRGSSPDILEIYTEEPDFKLGDIKPTNIYPTIQVFNDYDGDGTIGNHEKDRYVLMVSTIAKGKDLFKFLRKDDTESDVRDPRKFIYSLLTPIQSQLSYSIIEGTPDLERRSFGGRMICGKYALLDDDRIFIIDGTFSVREDLLERIDYILDGSTTQYQYCKKQVLNKY